MLGLIARRRESLPAPIAYAVVIDEGERAMSMSNPEMNPQHPGRHSREADAAAARWGDRHPDEDLVHVPPSTISEVEDWIPGHHSAAAEAASLRWHEQHEDEYL
jgi:hypothetical protein